MKPCGSCSWVSSIYEKIIVKNQYSNTFIYQNWSEAGVTRYPSNEFIKIFKNKIWRFLSWWRPNPLAYILCLESPSFLFKQNGTFFFWCFEDFFLSWQLNLHVTFSVSQIPISVTKTNLFLFICLYVFLQEN